MNDIMKSELGFDLCHGTTHTNVNFTWYNEGGVVIERTWKGLHIYLADDRWLRAFREVE